LVPLSIQAAEIFSSLKSKYQRKHNLKRKSMARDTVDLMIASSAIEKEVTLVSNDKIFHKIQEISSDFKLENWTV
jgi:predicted nucleic acid-binding protein